MFRFKYITKNYSLLLIIVTGFGLIFLGHVLLVTDKIAKTRRSSNNSIDSPKKRLVAVAFSAQSQFNAFNVLN